MTLLGLLSASVQAQDKPLTNADILRMVEAGLATDLIVTMISSSEGDYDTGVDSILILTQKNVPDEIIRAMLLKNEESTGGAAQAPAEQATHGGSALPKEVGVYYQKEADEQFHLLEPEIVTWKTGGFWKSMATAGLTKGHINGVVRGPRSSYVLKGSETLYLYCLEGTSGREYQLLRLWGKKNRREFRVITGGIVHASGGADENLVQFEPVRVTARVYKYRLPDLSPGEYGLLPPGANASASAASSGKIYTFNIGR